VAEASRPPRIEVTAAVIERGGAFLLTRRLDGTHLEGCWEFPGGKRHAGESLPACLEREIREELDAAIVVEDLIHTTSHDYPERTVELYFFRCALLTEPRPVLGQGMRWVPRGDLPSLRLPPADDELVQMLAGPAEPSAT
jgi:8-oxo-dGTP diphosphatase